MPLFGPRLDRASAIGDDGRPRATSLTVVSLVAAGLLFAVAHFAGVFGIASALLAVTGLVTLGMALLNRERFVALFLGQFCFVLSTTGLVALLSTVLALEPSYGLVLAGFTAALVGTSATWADVADRDSTTTVLLQGLVSYVVMVATLLLLVVVAVVGLVGYGLAVAGGEFAQTTLSVLVVVGTLLFTGLFVVLGLRWAPIEQLAPRDLRPRVVRLVRRVQIVVCVGVALGLVAAVVGVGLGVAGSLDALFGLGALLSSSLDVLSSRYVAGGVLLVGGAVFTVGVTALVLRRVTRPVSVTWNRIQAGVVAGFALSVLALPFVYSMTLIPVPGYRVLYALLVVVFGPAVVLFTGGLLVLGVELDVLPDRAGGPALAAAGLILATVGAGLVSVPAPLVFACAAGAMVTWDVSSFGLGVTEELGHLPETRRLELFHAVVAVGLSVAVVAAASALYLARESLVGSAGNSAAVLLAVVGVLLLLIPLRG